VELQDGPGRGLGIRTHHGATLLIQFSPSRQGDGAPIDVCRARFTVPAVNVGAARNVCDPPESPNAEWSVYGPRCAFLNLDPADVVGACSLVGKPGPNQHTRARRILRMDRGRKQDQATEQKAWKDEAFRHKGRRGR
jgi:hypothetical protein